MIMSLISMLLTSKHRIYGFWFHRARHMRCMRIGWTCIGKTTTSCLSKNLDIKLPFSSLSCPPWLSCDTVLCVIFEHVAFNCVCGCMTIRHVLLSVCHANLRTILHMTLRPFCCHGVSLTRHRSTARTILLLWFETRK